MLTKRTLPALAAYVILMVALGVWLQGVVGVVWRSWVDYIPPNVPVTPASLEAPTKPLVDRVVVVLIDGARPDVVEKLSNTGSFKTLLDRGCWFENAHALTPTYSVPARAAMATGLPHELSGVSSNWYRGGELKLPNVFSLAKEAGLRTAVVGDESLHYMFASSIDVYVEVEEKEGHMQKSIYHAIELLQGEPPPDLLWVSLADVDKAGHEHGAASQEYEDAAREASWLISELLDVLDQVPGETLVIIVSDHGHLDRGGHGGPEEEVSRVTLGLIGPHVRAGVRVSERVYYTSLAPTIVMALGLPPRLFPYSPPLVQAFTDDVAEAKSAYAVAMAKNCEEHIKALAGSLGITGLKGLEEASALVKAAFQALQSGDNARALDLSLEAFKKLSAVYETIRADPRINPTLSSSIPALALAALALVSLAVVGRHLGKGLFWRPVLGSLLGAAAFWMYFVRVEGYLPTMSSVNELGDYVNAIVNSTIVALAIAAAVTIPLLTVPRLTGREKARIWLTPIAAHLTMLTIFSAPIVVMLTTYGATVRFPFPDWRLAYMYYTALLTSIFLMLLNWLLPMAILVGAALTLKISGRYSG